METLALFVEDDNRKPHSLGSSSLEAGKLDEWSLVQAATTEISPEDQELLKEYHHSFDDERVDLDLIMHLLHNICTSSEDGERFSCLVTTGCLLFFYFSKCLIQSVSANFPCLYRMTSLF